MKTTKVPGKDSFTRALIYALETLTKESTDGRFTTVDLQSKIRDAPYFPKDQQPILFNREKKYPAGHIMLHPVRREGSDDDISREEASSLDPLKGHALTLHFDFNKKPSPKYVQRFGQELNKIFHHDALVNRVRWGGMRQAMAARFAKTLQKKVRKRRESRLQQDTLSDEFSYSRPAETGLDPLTPSSLDQHSPRSTEPAAKDSSDFNPADSSAGENEDHFQDHRERRKRRRCA